MIAKQEIHNYHSDVRLWAGKYRNSHNLLHWHGDCELIHVEKGQLEIFCEKRNHYASTGETLLIDSEQVHSMRPVKQDTVAVVIFFDKSLLAPHLDRQRLLCPKLRFFYDVSSLYDRFRTIFSERKPFYNAQSETLLLSLLIEIFQREELCVKSESKSAKSLKKLLLEIDERYDFYTFDDAVNAMHMSPAYFSRYFREATGMTFSQYLNYVRIDHAVAMLKEDGDVSMTEISNRCGFGTIRNFNRIFKELTGYAPRNLPENFLLGNTPLTSDTSFNPTITDCELIESLAE